MPYPPPTLPVNRTNATAQQDTHPADHNAANLAINDVVSRLNALIAQVGAIPLQGRAWGGFTIPDGYPGEYLVDTGVAIAGLSRVLFFGTWASDPSASPFAWVPWQSRLLFGATNLRIGVNLGGGVGNTFQWTVLYVPV